VAENKINAETFQWKTKVPSRSATQESGAMGREFESRQGIPTQGGSFLNVKKKV
jgi:hypothetical protein